MVFKNYPDDPTLYRMRDGVQEPFIAIEQTDKVRNQTVLLKEIPDKFQSITVTDGTKSYSVKNGGFPDTNTIVVDWKQGILTTHSLLEGKTLNVSYYGKGSIYLPSSKVYVDVDKTTGEVTETLKDLTDNMMENRDLAAETNELVQLQEDIREQNEDTRQTQENQRQANTNSAIGRIDNAIDRTTFVAPYSTTTTYQKNNIVSFSGHSFMAKKQTKGNNPPDPTVATQNEYWALMARKGADGTGTVHVHRDRFIATEGQTIFTLSHPYDQFQNRTNVTVGGVPQKTPDNYEEISSDKIAFYDGLSAGTIVEVKYFSEAQPLQTDIETVVDNHTEEINKFNNQSLHNETFTATAGQKCLH